VNNASAVFYVLAPDVTVTPTHAILLYLAFNFFNVCVCVNFLAIYTLSCLLVFGSYRASLVVYMS